MVSSDAVERLRRLEQAAWVLNVYPTAGEASGCFLAVGPVVAGAVFGAWRLILSVPHWRLGVGHVASYAGTRLRTVSRGSAP